MALFRRQVRKARLRGADAARRPREGRRLALPHGPRRNAISGTSVGLREIRDAAARLLGVAHRTPVVRSRTLDARCEAEVFLKCENLQRMGAFKFRGAYNLLSTLTPEQKARGVVAFSSGNHAQ
ncbi:MAG TPA: pyridoxal-phosphate dependent enzyme, partial [Candidatus Baltobacteraceae bacterium]|nr:pyridoxal-phosphate dependent enzyme [Candidatus Baltobacteraceae bacterium]